MESKKYPRLQQYGSDGLYYTQAEVRDVIAYARDRGVRIVPEFDMPGHATSWLPGYPKLGSGPGPYEIVHGHGILTALMDPTKESTYRFLDGFVGEMAKLFPDEYFHIGGDEVVAERVERESEDSGVHEKASPRECESAPDLLQSAPVEDRDQAPQAHGGLG